MSDCAYWGNWGVLCEQDDEEPQSYRDEEEFAERATLGGDLLRDVWRELVEVRGRLIMFPPFPPSRR